MRATCRGVDGGAVPGYDKGVMTKRRVMVLNADFRPLSAVSWQRGMRMQFEGNCFILELARTYVGEPIIIHSPRAEWNLPSVMMNPSYVSMGDHIRYSRYNAMWRDSYRCQYCGSDEGEMTIDHVRPKVEVKGQEKDLWRNRVVCCSICNGQKGHRSLDVMRHERCWNGKLFRLIREPTEPKTASISRFIRLVTRDSLEWLSYIPGWRDAARHLGRGWLIQAHEEWAELHANQANLDLISSSTAASPPDD